MAILCFVMLVVQVGEELPPLPGSSPMEARTGAPEIPSPEIPSPEIPSPEVPPGGGRMGLALLERIALENNPTLVQAAERIEQARGNVDQSGRYPNPFAVWNSQSIGVGDTVGAQGAFVQQPIITGGKLRINRSRYEVDVEIARWNLVEQQYRIVNGVRLRYWEILLEQRLIQFGERATGMAEDVVRAVREKVETGHASEADLLLAENEVSQIKVTLENMRVRYLNSWRELAAFVGRPDLQPTHLIGSLERERGDERPFDWEPTLDRLLAESPEVKASELNVVRAQRRLRREEVETIPDLILRGGAAYDPANEEMIGIARVYVDLPLWDRNQGNIYTAQHVLIDVRRDLDRARFSVQQRLARRITQHQTSLINVRRLRDEVLPRALRAYELYLEAFLEEDEGYSRVQSTLGSYIDASIKLSEELQQLRNSETAIVGMLIVDETIEGGTPRPSGGEVPQAPTGGGAPAGGSPSRNPN